MNLGTVKKIRGKYYEKFYFINLALVFFSYVC